MAESYQPRGQYQQDYEDTYEQGQQSEGAQRRPPKNRKEYLTPHQPQNCPYKLPRFGPFIADPTLALHNVEAEIAYIHQTHQRLPESLRVLTDETKRLACKWNTDWIDFSAGSPDYIRLEQKVFLPEPKRGENVVGRLLGKRGQTLRAITQKYKCKIQICGKGSKGGVGVEKGAGSRDSPYNAPLHCVILMEGDPTEVYHRMADILRLIFQICTMTESFEFEGLPIDLYVNKFDQKNESDQQGNNDGSERKRKFEDDQNDNQHNGRSRFDSPSSQNQNNSEENEG
ncbi:unnamed protein product [Bursaphelenchus xylophilus]|uniref:(pine wood nematode) hypothetical protein n=1 Tax=Bursaphelenchus xylophilus TaxID=6326 RepID=A0A1I7RVI9_BURXY|nr:unnamed protein product [Bursaphelenchus xylophilus]CAG9081741.1 unnamed protein product [Bursaphelenchus xylophilus]